MAAYDNPSGILRTKKFAGVGPNQPTRWAFVKGKLKGSVEGDAQIELTTFTKFDIGNLNQLKAGEGELEVIYAPSE